MTHRRFASGPAVAGTRLLDRLLWAGVVLLLVLIAGPVLTISLHIPINYNEGWNAGWDSRAVLAGAGPLYPDRTMLLFNNYPPLGFILVGMAGRVLFGGDMILAGRVVALLALLAAALLAGCCVRRLGGSARAGWASVLLMLLVAATFFRGYVAMDDPQWLAHAVMLGGLAILLGDHRFPARRVLAGCALMVAGGFIKHNLVALPVATTLFLCWVRPRAGLLWIAAALAFLALGVALVQWRYGPVAFADILHHRRVFRVHLLTHAISRLAPLLPALLLMLLVLRRADAGAMFAGSFAIVALVTGTLQRMGEGVYYNAHFEALIAASIGFGLVLDRVLRLPVLAPRGRFAPSLLILFALSPVLGALPWHLPIAWHAVVDRHREERAWRPVIARLAAAPGPVGCNLMSLCTWAGKPSRIDMFNLTQSVLAGGPIDRFHALIGTRAFALLEDDPNSFLHSDAVRKLGHDPIMDSVRRRYDVVARGPDGIVLMAPKRSGP